MCQTTLLHIVWFCSWNLRCPGNHKSDISHISVAFIAYLMTMDCWRWFMKYELEKILNKAFVAWLWYYPNIRLEWLIKNHRQQDSGFPGIWIGDLSNSSQKHYRLNRPELVYECCVLWITFFESILAVCIVILYFKAFLCYFPCLSSPCLVTLKLSQCTPWGAWGGGRREGV
jgi:hypothetical protein